MSRRVQVEAEITVTFITEGDGEDEPGIYYTRDSIMAAMRAISKLHTEIGALVDQGEYTQAAERLDLTYSSTSWANDDEATAVMDEGEDDPTPESSIEVVDLTPTD